MNTSWRRVLLGGDRSSTHLAFILGVGISLFGVTFASYALGFFYVSGGLVFVPFYGAVVGILGGIWAGFRQEGLVFGWVLTYFPLLGYLADHYLLGLSHRSIGYRLAAFFQPEGLAVLGIQALVLGTLAFVVGTIGRHAIEYFRGQTQPTHPG